MGINRFFKKISSILSITITAVFLICSLIIFVSANPGNSEGQIKLHTTLKQNAIVTIQIDVLDSTNPAGYNTITLTLSRDNNGNYDNWITDLPGEIGEGIKMLIGNDKVSNSEIFNNGNIVSYEKLNLCVRVYIDGEIAEIYDSDNGNGNGNKSVWNIWVKGANPDITNESSTSTDESTASTTESTASTTDSTASTTDSTASTNESTASTTESTASTTESTASTSETSTTSSDPEVEIFDLEVPLAGPEPSVPESEDIPDTLVPLDSPPNTGVSTGLIFFALSIAVCGMFILFVFHKKANA